MIILSRAQTRQPQTATRLAQKWIGKGLVALFDLRTGVELITGLAASENTGTPIAGLNGVGRDFSGSANVQFPHDPRFVLTGDITIAALVDIDALSGYTAIISKNATPTTATPYELRLGVGTTDSQIDFVRANSGVRENKHGATTLGAGYSGLIVATQREAIQDATGKFYTKDGTYPLATGAGAGTGPSTDTGAAVWIGRRYDGATQLDGRIYYVALFNKFLSDFESKELIADPWQLFPPASRRIWVAPTAGGNTAALTGLTATATQGTPTPSLSLAVSGNSSTASAGSVAPALSLAITGNSATATQGAVTPSLSLALAGNTATTTAGTPTSSVPGDVALTGNSATSSQGTPVAALSLGLTGNTATGSAGSVTSALSQTAALAGNTATATQGAPVAALSLGLTGNSATATAGTILPASGNLTVALTGNTATATAGLLSTGAGAGGYDDDKKKKRKAIVLKELSRLNELILKRDDEPDAEVIEAVPTTPTTPKAPATAKFDTALISAKVKQQIIDEDDDEEEALMLLLY